MEQKNSINRRVASIFRKSIADELNIEKGDEVIQINNQKFNDIIEYLFLTADEYLEMEIEKKDGSIEIYEIEKEFDEDLGIVFENPIIDQVKRCRNKCIFCFVDQLPSNMRKTLYFKDDDFRLSFLHGNYITLTNLSDNDIDKIIKYRISPINISIHTTDSELRVKMLRNKNAGNILAQLKKLTNARIQVHGQIVLCPDINDKENLERTISDLSDLYPNLESVAIVPVGITRYREGLYPLKIFDEQTARKVIKQVEVWQNFFLKKYNTRFIFLSDEFYVIANKDIPPYEAYESFLQLENGVGLMAKFEHELRTYLKDIRLKTVIPRSISIATGKSASEFIKKLCCEIMRKFPYININIFSIKNEYFGETITVAGLVTGTDLIKQLKGKELGERLLIPSSMLKADESVFLDGIHISEVEEKLNVSIVVSQIDGKDFINKILE